LTSINVVPDCPARFGRLGQWEKLIDRAYRPAPRLLNMKGAESRVPRRIRQDVDRGEFDPYCLERERLERKGWQSCLLRTTVVDDAIGSYHFGIDSEVHANRTLTM
jgi:hypothetical protein